MTLLKSRELANDAGFCDRVRVAVVMAAVDVASEDDQTANHAARLSLAQRILMGPGPWGQIIAEAVAVNSTIIATYEAGEAIPDGDLEFVTNSLFDAYAGVSG